MPASSTKTAASSTPSSIVSASLVYKNQSVSATTTATSSKTAANETVSSLTTSVGFISSTPILDDYDYDAFINVSYSNSPVPIMVGANSNTSREFTPSVMKTESVQMAMPSMSAPSLTLSEQVSVMATQLQFPSSTFSSQLEVLPLSSSLFTDYLNPSAAQPTTIPSINGGGSKVTDSNTTNVKPNEGGGYDDTKPEEPEARDGRPDQGLLQRKRPGDTGAPTSPFTRPMELLPPSTNEGKRLMNLLPQHPRYNTSRIHGCPQGALLVILRLNLNETKAGKNWESVIQEALREDFVMAGMNREQMKRVVVLQSLPEAATPSSFLIQLLIHPNSDNTITNELNEEVIGMGIQRQVVRQNGTAMYLTMKLDSNSQAKGRVDPGVFAVDVLQAVQGESLMLTKDGLSTGILVVWWATYLGLMGVCLLAYWRAFHLMEVGNFSLVLSIRELLKSDV